MWVNLGLPVFHITNLSNLSNSAKCKDKLHATQITVADPGFPRGGDANSPGGRQIRFVKISQKLHEYERIWTPGGGGGGTLVSPLDPSLNNFPSIACRYPCVVYLQ